MDHVGRQFIMALGMGATGAVLFLFAFPGLAIPTLMHKILKLPGPGIGFGFILGPFIIACSLIAYGFTKKYGIAVITSAMFSITISILIFILKLETPGPGKFGSIEFITGLIILGLSLEACLYLFKGMSSFFPHMISAIISDIIFVSYSLFFIFSHTVPEKYAALTLNKILIIFTVSVIGAVLFCLLAVIVLIISKGR